MTARIEPRRLLNRYVSGVASLQYLGNDKRLRQVPPDHYVFNYRASYSEETEAAVRYLVKVRGVQPNEIAVFAQQDSYGAAQRYRTTCAAR